MLEQSMERLRTFFQVVVCIWKTSRKNKTHTFAFHTSSSSPVHSFNFTYPKFRLLTWTQFSGKCAADGSYFTDAYASRSNES